MAAFTNAFGSVCYGNGVPVGVSVDALGLKAAASIASILSVFSKKVETTRSQICFVMHPKDEAEFVSMITAEPGTVFVDGPSWSGPRPPIVTEVEKAGNYLIVWNPSETPELKGKHYRKDSVEWWYCENEFLTIQFLRSGFQYGKSFLFQGRIAIQTTERDGSYFHGLSATAIERRFKRLRNLIKKTYTNNVIIWQQTGLPRGKTNPSKPTASDWVGPYAMEWLREAPEERWVQQEANPRVARGYLLDLVQP